MYKSSLKFLRFHLGFDFQNPFRADTFGSEAPLSGAELAFAKFGSNFFVNLDQKRRRVRKGGGAPCAAARTERPTDSFSLLVGAPRLELELPRITILFTGCYGV